MIYGLFSDIILTIQHSRELSYYCLPAPTYLPTLPCGDLSNIDYSIALLWRRYPDDSLPAYLPACLPACLPALPLRGSLEYRLLNRLVVEEIFGRFPACLPTLSLRGDISTISRLPYLLPVYISKEIST